MTSRERLQAVFNRQTPDRVPIWMMFPFENEPFAANIHTESSYQDVTELVFRHTDFIERNAVNFELLSEKTYEHQTDFLFNHQDIHKERKVLEKGNRTIFADVVTYGGIEMKKEVIVENGQRKILPFFREITDVQKAMEFPFETPVFDLARFRTKAENLGHKGLHGLQLIDPISVLHDNCSETDFVLWCYEYQDIVTKFLEVIQPRIKHIHEQFLQNNVGEIFWLSGPEFLCPPFASPKLFDKFVRDHDKPIVDMIRAYGKKTMLHCHGNVRKVLNSIKIIQPDALHPIEAPPFGDCTLKEARDALGPEVVLVGNIEYSDLNEKSAGEIDFLVQHAISETDGEGFILAPTCTPYEAKIGPKLAENYQTMINAGLKYGAKK